MDENEFSARIMCFDLVWSSVANARVLRHDHIRNDKNIDLLKMKAS